MDIVITNIGQLITPIDYSLRGSEHPNRVQIIRNTTLAIRDGRIVSDDFATDAANVKTINANGCVVMPGLIDPFWVMPRLPTWIDEVPHAKLPGRDLSSWSRRLLQRAVRIGVTTVEVKYPYDLEFTGLGHLAQQHQPRVIGTLLASLPDERQARESLMSMLIGEVIPEIRRRRLATFCDIGWKTRGDFITEARTVLRAAMGVGLRPKLHLQAPSSIENIRDFVESLDVAAIGCASNLSSAAIEQLSEDNVSLVHLPVVPSGIADKSRCVRALLEQGIRIALGTGNGLSDSTPRSMWSVLMAAIDSMNMSLMEAIEACTLNNAMAIEMSHELGSLEQGKRADLILLDLADYREIPAAVDSPPVAMVMINGDVVYSS